MWRSAGGGKVGSKGNELGGVDNSTKYDLRAALVIRLRPP